MMSTAIDAVPAVTDETFAHEVLSSQLPVLVDFTADWCPGCRMIAPVLAQIAAENGERLRIVSLNTDYNPETAASYGVLGLPTLMLFRAGEPVFSLAGSRTKNQLMKALADAL